MGMRDSELTRVTTVPDTAIVAITLDPDGTPLLRASLVNDFLAGRTLAAIASFGIRSSEAAFDLQIQSSEVFTANRALSIVLGNTARTLTIGASASVSGSNTGDQDLSAYLPLAGGTLSGALTITPPAATAALISTTSNTGSDATSAWTLNHTVNTTGSPDVFAIKVTDTARGATTKLLNVYAGAAGATSMFSVDRSGNTVAAGGLTTDGTILLKNGATTILGAVANPTNGVYVRLAVTENYYGAWGTLAQALAGASTGRGFYADSTLIASQSGGRIGFSSGDATNTLDTLFTRVAAANLRLGNASSAAPIANILTVGESSRGGTDSNVAGANGTLQSGLGTGNAVGSSLIFRTPTAGSTGTAAESYATRLTLNESGAQVTKAGIGVAPTRFLDVLGTTEQLRVAYDASNYYSTTVGSAGEVTFNAVGAGAGFTFSDNITALELVADHLNTRLRFNEPDGIASTTIDGVVQPAIHMDLTDLATNTKRGIMMDVRTTSTTGTIRTGGVAVKIFTPPDNGGDSSAFFGWQTGGGNAGSLFKLTTGRDSGYTDYPNDGVALEAAANGGAHVIVAQPEDGAAFRAYLSSPFFPSATGGLGLQVQPGADTDLGRRAVQVISAVGSVEKFFVTLAGTVYAADTVTAVNGMYTTFIDLSTGVRFAGGANAGNVLRGNGTNFVSAQLAAADLSNDVSGSGAVALVGSPTFTAPVLGAASATSLTASGALAAAAANAIAISQESTHSRFLALGPDATTAGSMRFTIAESDGGGQIEALIIANTGSIAIGGGTAVKNIRHGVSGAMVLGSVTVTDAGCTANTRYFFSAHTLGTVSIPGGYYASTLNAGTSFVIQSSQPTETSTIDWIAIEP